MFELEEGLYDCEGCWWVGLQCTVRSSNHSTGLVLLQKMSFESGLFVLPYHRGCLFHQQMNHCKRLWHRHVASVCSWGRLVWIWDSWGWSWLCVAWEKIFIVSWAGWVDQHKQPIPFTATQEHLLLSSLEIPHSPLMSLSHTKERWPCRLFCIFSREALVLKVFWDLVMEYYKHLTAHPCTGLGTLHELSILLEKPWRKSFLKSVIFRH